MGGDRPFQPSRRSALDDVPERRLVRGSPEAARTPLAQVVLHAALDRFAEQSPRLPTRSRHHADVRKFLVRVLRAIAAAQRLDDAHDLAALLEAHADERLVDEVRHHRVGGDEDMRPGHNDSDEECREALEEASYRITFASAQRGEAGQRLPLRAVECRRDAPHAAAAVTSFRELRGRVFENAVRRIRDDRLDRVRLGVLKPAKGVHVVDHVCARQRGRTSQPCLAWFQRTHMVLGAVNRTASHELADSWRGEPSATRP